MKKDVIIACDFATKDETLAFLNKFEQEKPFVKIGMQLFYGEGPSVVTEIKSRGHNVFLDLKLHDIPNTVGRSMQNLAKLGVNMVNLHAAGGKAMMQAAMDGLVAGCGGGQPPLLIAVTQLTSISTEIMNSQLLIPGQVKDIVAAYAQNAQQAGLQGVVCSPLEAKLVKASCGQTFLTVTPGIRYPGGNMGDQQRVTTPAQAAAFSNFIVVGRPITAAANPAQAYAKVKQDFFAGEIVI